MSDERRLPELRPRPRYTSLSAASALLLLALLVSGCSDEPTGSDEPPPSGVLQALHDANDAGDASPEQIAILEAARDEGRDVTEEEYRAAYAKAVECTRDAGVTVVRVDEVYDAGTLQLNMTINGRQEDEDFMFAAVGACEHKHSSYVDAARQLSASAKQDAIVAQYVPAMIECVNKKGARLSLDATYDQALEQDPDIDDPQKSCVVTSGLQAALTAPPG